MAMHSNQTINSGNRDINSLTASAGTLGTPTFKNDVEFAASYRLGGGLGLATFSAGATATLTSTNDGDGSDSWITAAVLKLTGQDTTTPFRQSVNAGTAAGGASSVSVTLASAPLVDSLLVAVCVANNNNAWSLPSGWDAITGLAESTWGAYHATTWKNGTDGSTTTYTIPCAGNTSGLGVTLFEIAAAATGATNAPLHTMFRGTPGSPFYAGSR